MSRSLRLTLLLVTSLVTPAALAQICTGDVELTSQSAVDAFDCAEITGGLYVHGGTVTDLSPLAGLTAVGFGSYGGLWIWDTALTSLAGLETLTDVHGNESELGGVSIRNNDALTSLTGMESLTSVGGLGIQNNDALTSLVGLENLTTINGLYISGNEALTSLAGLEGLTSLGTLYAGDALTISGNEALTSLEGLRNVAFVGGNLYIVENAALTSLAGLENFTSINGLHISGNAALTSLAGLGGVTSLDRGLWIRENTALTSLVGLEGLTSVVFGCFGFCTAVSIEGNDALTSLAGLEDLTYVGDLVIADNAALESLAGLESLAAVGGGCDPDTFCTGTVYISGNDALMSIEGLSGLTSAGFLSINTNPALMSLAGLENVASIVDLYVGGNATLSDCACGLSGIMSGDPPMFSGVDGNVTIFSNAPDGLCTSPQVVLDASVDATCMPVASEPSAGVPDHFSLAPPYPNPFRRTATVGFAIPAAADVRLVLYDVLGRELAVLVDGPAVAAYHEVVFDAVGLPSGTYLVRMTTENGFAQTQRVTVLR